MPTSMNRSATALPRMRIVMQEIRRNMAPAVPAPEGLHDPREILAREVGPYPQVFCGPWALMAVTGRSLGDALDAVNKARNAPLGSAVTTVMTNEMEAILRGDGFKFGYMMASNGKAFSFATFLRLRTDEQMKQTFLVVAGKHVVVVHGQKATCAMLGRWVSVKHAYFRQHHVRAIMRVG